jgi:hypothetical protein
MEPAGSFATRLAGPTLPLDRAMPVAMYVRKIAG